MHLIQDLNRQLSIKHKWFSAVTLGLITIIAFWMMISTPKDFVPSEDDSFITYSLSLPAGTNLQYTTAVINRIDSAIRIMPETYSVTSVSGFNMLSNSSGPSYAMGFIRLKDKKERGEIKDMDRIIEAMTTRLDKVKSGELSLFRSPPVDGFGSSTKTRKAFNKQYLLNAFFKCKLRVLQSCVKNW
ncbi:MAG: efflux RND transporter permease subunit [Paludibacter sp.]